MKRLCKMIVLVLVACGQNLVCPCVLTAQDMVPPLDIPLLLSGNFGELRTNHFHAGTDIKTQEKIGQPVKAVKDGYVARIGVSCSCLFNLHQGFPEPVII
jgi:hypothetical protein